MANGNCKCGFNHCLCASGMYINAPILLFKASAHCDWYELVWLYQLSIWKFLWCYGYINMLLTQLANICRECQVYTGSLWLALQGNTNGNAQLMLFPTAHNLVKIRSNPDSLNLQIFGFNMNCYLSLTITPSKYTS